MTSLAVAVHHAVLRQPLANGSPYLRAIGASEPYFQYGSMFGVLHGNRLVTRFGHASRRLVGVGDVESRGAKIGEVVRTVRSTGPHLHFEVRLGGFAQNPAG